MGGLNSAFTFKKLPVAKMGHLTLLGPGSMPACALRRPPPDENPSRTGLSVWDFFWDFLSGIPELFRFLFGFRALPLRAGLMKTVYLQRLYPSDTENAHLRL